MSLMVRRLIGLPFVLLGIAFVVFLSLRLIPGDPALLISGLEASAEQVERVRRQLGLDKPIPVQFVIWLGQIVQGDFGNSIMTGRPVLPLLLENFGRTLELAVVASILASTIGVLVGVLAAAKPYSILDNVVTTLSLIGVSMPGFWLGIMLIVIFAVRLHWLPSGGTGTAKHLVLPAVSLATFSMGLVARMSRASMLEVLSHDYVRTARAKGAPERRILFRHALKNAFLEIITVIGLQFGYLLGGAVITETVFTWPGIGWLLVTSIFRRDFPIVQGAVLLVATCFVIVNLVTDLLYMWADPRIRL